MVQSRPADAPVNGAVLVLGSLNHDVLVRTSRHPEPGETVHGSSLVELPGGKGANQAVAAARGGATVSMVGAVGDDDNGRRLVRALRDDGIDPTHVAVRRGQSTGTAIVLVADTGENEIVVVAGANGTVADDDVAALDLTQFDVVVAQYETPVAATAVLFRRARAAGLGCVLNPAPAGRVTDELLGNTSVLVVNEHELTTVVDAPMPGPWSPDQARAMRGALTRRGFTGALVVTLGAAGVVAVTADALHELPAAPADVVDTTGAGDCFVGSLAAELAHGADLDHALAVGNAAAALSVARHGAAPSMPYRAEVVALMARRSAT